MRVQRDDKRKLLLFCTMKVTWHKEVKSSGRIPLSNSHRLYKAAETSLDKDQHNLLGHCPMVSQLLCRVDDPSMEYFVSSIWHVCHQRTERVWCSATPPPPPLQSREQSSLIRQCVWSPRQTCWLVAPGFNVSCCCKMNNFFFFCFV